MCFGSCSVMNTILGYSLHLPHYVVYPLPCHLVFLRHKYSPQHPTLSQPQNDFLPQCERPNFTPVQNKDKIIVMYFLTFLYLDGNLEDRDPAPNI
jgi:hypothetical protein